MNVMITGGLGVIGSWVARQLLQEGHRPLLFDRYHDTSLVADISSNIEICLGDIQDIAAILRVLKKYRIQIIAHVAGLTGRSAQNDPHAGFSVNAVGTVNILEAARIMDVERVVFTSSRWAVSPVAGDHGYPAYKPVDETHHAYPASPTTVYAAAKVASELMGNVYSEQYGLSFIALRFGQIFTPGKISNPTLQAQMMENAMSGHPTVIPQGGDEKDDMTYIKDVANAVVLSCFAKNVRHRLFHIGTGQGYTHNDFSDSIRKLYPQAVIDIGPGLRQPPGTGFVMDISRARLELGYEPRFGLDAAVKDYVQVMKQFNYSPRSAPLQANSAQEAIATQLA